MSNIEFLIPTIVGSIIGYLTNWLAIKMIFRPHHEVKILGMRVPFTPGLIPKERKRIANTIGNSISDYLLTEEELTKALSNEKMSNNIDNWIDGFFSDIEGSEKTFKDLFHHIDSNLYQEFIDYANEKVYEILGQGLRDDKIKVEIIELIEVKLRERLDDEKFYSNLQDRASKIIDSAMESEETTKFFTNIIEKQIEIYRNDDRSLAELLDEEQIGKIKNYVYLNKDLISEKLLSLLEEREIRQSIKAGFSQIVRNNIPKMMLMLVNEDTISDKIYKEFIIYLMEEDSKDKIAFTLNNVVISILDTKISSIANEIAINISRENISSFLKSSFKDLFIGNKDDMVGLIGKTIEENKGSFINNLMFYIEGEMDNILRSQDFKARVKVLIKDKLDKLMGSKISILMEDMDQAGIKNLSMLIKNQIMDMIIKKAPRLIEELNIANIVEEKINSFDVEFTEELILDIAERELKAITNLGAVLGAIMGFIGSIF